MSAIFSESACFVAVGTWWKEGLSEWLSLHTVCEHQARWVGCWTRSEGQFGTWEFAWVRQPVQIGVCSLYHWILGCRWPWDTMAKITGLKVIKKLPNFGK